MLRIIHSRSITLLTRRRRRLTSTKSLWNLSWICWSRTESLPALPMGKQAQEKPLLWIKCRNLWSRNSSICWRETLKLMWASLRYTQEDASTCWTIKTPSIFCRTKAITFRFRALLRRLLRQPSNYCRSWTSPIRPGLLTQLQQMTLLRVLIRFAKSSFARETRILES